MTKIVYNACYGGFGLSEAAIARYCQLKKIAVPQNTYDLNIARSDPILAKVVTELGEAANGKFAHLKIRNLKKGTLYRIDEYDGNERVMTKDDYDWQVA